MKLHEIPRTGIQLNTSGTSHKVMTYAPGWTRIRTRVTPVSRKTVEQCIKRDENAS
jgi:hypothetical protein